MYTVVRARGSRFYAAEARRFIADTAIYEHLVSPGSSSGVAVTEVPPVRHPRTKPESRAHRVSAQAPHGIQAMEKALQQRWLLRLDAICPRAQLTDPSVPRVLLIAGLDARLLSLGSGAWRTHAGRVRRFERLERDLPPAAAFPLTLDLLAQHCGSLSHWRVPGF